MKIIIPMAGKSIRFFNENYTSPKYFLKIGKKFVIEIVMNMFDENDEIYLIFSHEQKKKYAKNIQNLKKIKRNIHIKYIKDHSKGPVYSIISANFDFYESDIIVAYNDVLVDWDYKKFLRVVKGYDGAIVSFKGFHPASFSGTLYCYLKSKNKLVKDLREKKSYTSKPYNEPASGGIYYFDNLKNFLESANKLIKSKNKAIKNEFYVSQVYLNYLKLKKNILDYEANKFISLGAPKDYEVFLYWKNYFQKYEKS
jgi:NDP-sugar pyrophosphorylase family protein